MAVRPASDLRRCVVCGGVAAQTEFRYCSNACRQRAYRARVIAADRTREARQVRQADAEAPSTLPAALDSFIGRKHELNRIAQLFRHHRLVTLVGPAGVGKSRLATEFASRLPGAQSRTVAMVLLDSVKDDRLVGQAVTTAVGVREQPDKPITESLFATLRAPKMVVVLDNCEHLVDACAEFVATALRRCGDLRILATSREALGIPGEAVFSIDGLAVTAPGHEPVEAGRLFVDRAQALVHDFALSPKNAADVLAICTELDGNPLAIELAARWVPVLPVHNIREQLSRQLDMLATNRRAAHSRQVHRSLREAIDWGYQLLTDQERVVFRRLSVLTGAFDATAAIAVCADDDLTSAQILPLLAQLRAKSLLTSMEPDQFRQLRSIRLYGRQCLDATGETESTKERMITWLAGIVAPLQQESMAFSFDMLPKVGAMADNLLTALQWTAAAGDPRMVVLSIATALGWLYRGHISNGRKLLATTLARSDISAEDRCLMLRYAGSFASVGGDQREGVALLSQAVTLAESLGSPLAEAGARYLLGGCYSVVGRLDEAEQELTESVALARTAGHALVAAVVAQGLAWILLVRGNVDRAAALMADAVVVVESRPAVNSICRVYCTEAAIAVARGNDDRAETYFTRALPVSTVSKLSLLAVEGIAVVAQRRGQFARAVGLISAADAARHAENVPVEPFWGRLVKQSFAVAEKALGHQRVQQIADQARHLTMPQLISYALHDVLPERPVIEQQPGELDDGERRVAVLVAEGLTNDQIAKRLRISPRTVAYRVRQIRGKLSLNSRTEISTWLSEHSSSNKPE